VMDTATLLSKLRERDVKLWIEEERLKCSAPVGALDPEMRAMLASRKEEIMAFLRQAEARKNGPAAIVPIKPEGRRLPLFAVSGHGGDVFWLLALARHLDAEQPVLGVQPPGLDGSEPLRSVEALARYEVEQIRSYRPHGPYLIAGHCAGGTIAFEVAQQLTSAGEEVALVALIGTPYPTMFRQAPQLLLRLRRHLRALTTGSFAERKRYVVSRLQGRLQMREEMAGVSPAVMAARWRVESATVEAVRNYTPRHYANHIDLFVTRDEWHRSDLWRAVASTAREQSLGYFDIDDLLLGSQVEVLAKLLQDRLTSAQNAIDHAGRAQAAIAMKPAVNFNLEQAS
jgi:thioesterase domain-containing protein